MRIQASGVYRVYHYAHRMPHEVTMLEGGTFPRCRTCGDRVQFAPLIAATPAEKDPDFSDEMAVSA